MDWSTLIAIIGSLGGAETIRYFINRKTNRQLEEAKAEAERAKAEQEETKADHDDFAVLREVNIFLQEQLKQKEIQDAAKENRFQEQTQIVREQNATIIKLTGEVEALKAERRMKLCERRGCAQREPESGY